MPPDCECTMKDRIDALERANNRHADTHKEFYERLRDLEKWQGVQNERYNNIDDKLDDLTSMVKEIAAKPGKRWDGVVDKAVWSVCAAVIAFLLARFGL